MRVSKFGLVESPICVTYKTKLHQLIKTGRLSVDLTPFKIKEEFCDSIQRTKVAKVDQKQKNGKRMQKLKNRQPHPNRVPCNCTNNIQQLDLIREEQKQSKKGLVAFSI